MDRLVRPSAPRRWRRAALRVLSLGTVTALGAQAGLSAQTVPSAAVVNDSHFHLTNYVQRGTDIHDFLKIMGDKVGRVALFGIPLQQTWSYGNTGDLRSDLLPADGRAPLLLLVHGRLHRTWPTGRWPRSNRPASTP